MSKILKGLNEVNPHNYDSDWDYQNAVASSGRSRSSYRSQEDDTSDADIAYSKKMYQLSQKQKRDADHDRLATGTNESEKINPIGFQYVTNELYDIAFRRVGANAGQCNDFEEKKCSIQSHYFIKFEKYNKNIIKKINSHIFPSNTVGPRSLSKGEVNKVLNEIVMLLV